MVRRDHGAEIADNAANPRALPRRETGLTATEHRRRFTTERRGLLPR
ncbi:hypothetical protein [Actinoplanes couchii]|nr:hypothetical protein [Actinoplanes couchii]MDR6320236.1 hypothetical protein [Actinoplanes couchii]